jgi:hypothetical protein
MLLSFLREREVKPMRVYVATRAVREVRSLISHLLEILFLGEVSRKRYEGLYIVSGAARLPAYTRHPPDFFSSSLQSYDSVRTALASFVSRYASAFPAATQDELIRIEQHLERVDRVLSVIRAHLPFTANTEIEIDLGSLRRILEALGAEVETAALEDKSATLLLSLNPARDFRYSTKLQSNRANWDNFFDDIGAAFGQYAPAENIELNKLRAKFIEILADMQKRCVRAVLFTEGNSSAQWSMEREFGDLMGEVNFDVDAEEADAHVLARVPTGLIVLADGVFDAEQFTRMPNDYQSLSRIGPFVKAEHQGEYEKLLARALEAQNTKESTA